MKPFVRVLQSLSPQVASRAEAWIETKPFTEDNATVTVASRAEAWIETIITAQKRAKTVVASRAEAWIETSRAFPLPTNWAGRLPCGGVD